MKNYYQLVDSKYKRLHQRGSYTKKDINYFLLTSANLYNLMPQIPIREHETMFRNILFHQFLAYIEQSNLSIIDKCKIEGCPIEKVSLPIIFCSFHLSSYRLNLAYLLKKGIPISLIASDAVIREQGEQIQETSYKITGKRGLTIINSEKTTSIIQMIRELKRGNSLFIYIDGNSGVGGMKRDLESLMKLDFFNRTLYVRKGVAFLSHYAQIPIIPMIAYRNSLEDVRIHFFPSIEPSVNNRDSYCLETTKFLYDNFSNWLSKFPEQWEAWLYLHKYLDTDSIAKSYSEEFIHSDIAEGTYKFNNNRYGFLFLNEDIFLFDRHTYRSCQINKDIYELLNNDFLLKKKNKVEILEFVNKKILIKQ